MKDGRGKIVANARGADDAPRVRIEFFGLARERAGVSGCEVAAKRLTDALRAIERAFPRFQNLLTSVLAPSSVFRVSLDGERFLIADEVLLPGAKLLVLSGDAGG
jgi:molybdopterin converting factor small subunit